MQYLQHRVSPWLVQTWPAGSGAPQHYVSYSVKMPLVTHWRKATCEEVACQNYALGWRIKMEDLSPQMLHLATHSGRKFTPLEINADEHWLVFEPGQHCFEQHRTTLGRPANYIRRGGDWRQWTGEPYRFKYAEDWCDDFANHQMDLADIIRKG